MYVLAACEESQEVCKAFRDKGHLAYSCDIQPCSGGFPEWHLQGDVLDFLNFKWDLIIAFPPCTYLSNAGSVRLRPGGVLNEERYKKALAARDFFMKFYNHPCPKICIENPTPGSIHCLPPYSQVIEPFMFGEPWKKRTCLWLKNLPILFGTDIVVPEGHWVNAHSSYRFESLKGHVSAKMRSKTFPGVARAMAAQWG